MPMMDTTWLDRSRHPEPVLEVVEGARAGGGHGPSLFIILLLVCVMTVPAGCRQTPPESPLFESLPPERTGIDFVNRLEEKPGNNILETEFFYNGGGVAVGDVSGDGLPDIYFTANQGENALYLNLGDYRFRNITREAGVADEDGWSAGAVMADVNGDGLLDIYVCKAGKTEVDERRNKLYINSGELTFTDRAAEFGLDDPGYCTQAVFFDSNADGLLDVFIVNYNVRTFTNFDIRTIRDKKDPYAGDKLYRNNGDGAFTDVSEDAGIIRNPLGFGLSATVSDLSGDGLPDIYVANDFMERDYMYINQGDGIFRDEVLERTDVISYFSMGSDIADINNDGLPDILVVDMLPPDYTRRRMFRYPDPAMYDLLVANGYHRANMRNVLQINNGDGTFTEAGRLAGISMSDWSWASLIADFDNDGLQDIVITNGFPRFYTNQDYLNDILWKQFPGAALPDDPQIRYELVQKMEKVEMHNFAFRNAGNLSFTDATESWGLKAYSVSGGAAHADLNDDGSLDLIISNINEPPFILKNNAGELYGNNWLKIRLQGSGANSFGIGSKVSVTSADGSVFFREMFPVRGFQSSVEPVLQFGVNDLEQVDVEITWPDGTKHTLQDVAVNQTLTLNQAKAVAGEADGAGTGTEEDHRGKMFLPLDQAALGLDFIHEGGIFRDRITTPLMPHTLSNLGPALAHGDINSDGLEDVFVGGGYDQRARLYFQQLGGTFLEIGPPLFEEHRAYEDIDALFFDANGDGHLDLYVVSGGNFYSMNGPEYQDRLYINDGFGNYQWDRDALPRMLSSGGTVKVVDIEGNGIPDLFVGGRTYTGRYPVAPRSYLLENSNGRFRDVTRDVAPELMNPGLVTSAAWTDIDNDGNAELILAGEWMPIRIFKNSGNREFTEITRRAGLEKTRGWWNVLQVADLNEDGHPDVVAGNWGLNSFYRATPENPVIVYVDDFNNDGFYDPVMTQVIDGRRYPVPARDLLLRQLPELERKFPDYASYSTATIREILSRRQIRNAHRFEVHTFESMIFKNNGDGTFDAVPLPHEAQIAPVHDMIIADFYRDGALDVLLVGNNFGTQPETGPVAAQGVMLRGDGDFGFAPVLAGSTGMFAAGDVRRIELVPTAIGPLFLLARYNNALAPYLYRYEAQELPEPAQHP